MIRKTNLARAFSDIPDHWNPRIVGAVNDCAIKIVRLDGEFVWHAHEHEDEAFLVIDGDLEIQLRDGSIRLGPGELAIIPRTVEHRPVAHAETRVLLFEPNTTVNTGAERNDRTRLNLESI